MKKEQKEMTVAFFTANEDFKILEKEAKKKGTTVGKMVKEDIYRIYGLDSNKAKRKFVITENGNKKIIVSVTKLAEQLGVKRSSCYNYIKKGNYKDTQIKEIY